MILSADRVALLRALQARGVRVLDLRVSLIGDYREDDERRRWRVLAAPTGGLPIRTYSGRTPEEAIDEMCAELADVPEVA